MNKAKAPIFISGVYRSGTTLPIKMLNAHPNLALTHDSLNFFRYYLKHGAEISTVYPEIVKDVSERLGTRFGIVVPVGAILAELNKIEAVTFAQVYDRIMHHTFAKGDVSVRWGEKSLMQWSNIPLFLNMFPNSKALMIIRDPRSVLASFRDFTIEKDQRYLDAIFTCLNAMHWASTVGSVLDPQRFKVIYFEQMVKDLEIWSKEVCDFLEVEYSSDMMNPEKYIGHQGEPWKSNSSYSNSATSSRAASQRWKSKLREVELCFAESILGEQLELHGYELSGVRIDANELNELLGLIGSNDLIHNRLSNWFETGNGVESHPSNATNPKNWSKTMKPKI